MIDVPKAPQVYVRYHQQIWWQGPLIHRLDGPAEVCMFREENLWMTWCWKGQDWRHISRRGLIVFRPDLEDYFA